MLLPEIPGAVPDSGFACHRTTQCREADLHDHPSASRCQAVRPAGASLSRRERSLPSAAVSQGWLSVSPIRARLARLPYDGRRHRQSDTILPSSCRLAMCWFATSPVNSIHRALPCTDLAMPIR
jgi:hypothetical protein